MTDERGGDGLKQAEEGAEGAAEEDDVVTRVNGAGEGGLVAVEAGEDALEEGRGLGCVCGGGAGFAVAVELEELREEGENEGKGDLGRGPDQYSSPTRRGVQALAYKVEEEGDGDHPQDASARLRFVWP